MKWRRLLDTLLNIILLGVVIYAAMIIGVWAVIMMSADRWEEW